MQTVIVRMDLLPGTYLYSYIIQNVGRAQLADQTNSVQFVKTSVERNNTCFPSTSSTLLSITLFVLFFVYPIQCCYYSISDKV